MHPQLTKILPLETGLVPICFAIVGGCVPQKLDRRYRGQVVVCLSYLRLSLIVQINRFALFFLFFCCLLGQFRLWPPVSHACLLVSEVLLTKKLGGCHRNIGSVRFSCDAGCCTPTTSTLTQVDTLMAA